MPELIVPGNHDDLMWGLELKGTRKNWAWWWWWWLFMFKDKGKKKPRQLMVLWSGKSADKVKVRDHTWRKRFDPRSSKRKNNFHGLICSWFFDGKKMHDPLFIVDTPVSVWHTKKGGGVTGVSEKDYSFYGKPEGYTVALRNEGIDVQFRLTPHSKELSSPVHKVTRKPLGIRYEIYKHHRYDFEGDMMENGGFSKIEGSAYFQKVLVNSPAIPWYWGMFQSDNGYYLDYMFPHIGSSALRTTKAHNMKPESFVRYINPSIEFFDAKKKRWKVFTDVSIEKDYRNDRPVFKVTGRTKGSKIAIEATTYSRAHWRFEQNDKKKRIFYYNEYPAKLTGFEYTDGSEKLTLDDLGPTRGNCEHSWGKLY